MSQITISITITSERVSVGKHGGGGAQDLLAASITDPRTAEQVGALVAKTVAIAVVDAIHEQAGGGHGA